MKSRIHTAWFSASVCVIGVYTAWGSAFADESRDIEKYCEVHAAAMVAEMQAQSESPLQSKERALVRRTALKSCLVQNAPAQPVTEAVSQAARQVKPSASSGTVETSRNDGFWSALGSILNGSTERSKGHDRLRRRGRY